MSEMSVLGSVNKLEDLCSCCIFVSAGQVILDKLAPVKTVVHKTQVIDNTFRNFEMEVIAGESDFITLAREHGFLYKLDFSKVYWNPRLGKISSCISLSSSSSSSSSSSNETKINSLPSIVTKNRLHEFSD